MDDRNHPASSLNAEQPESDLIKHGTSQIHNLYHETTEEFRQVYRAGTSCVCPGDGRNPCLRESFSMLYLWAQGLDLHHFEKHVDGNSGLQNQVTRLLRCIQTILRSIGQEENPKEGNAKEENAKEENATEENAKDGVGGFTGKTRDVDDGEHDSGASSAIVKSDISDEESDISDVSPTKTTKSENGIMDKHQRTHRKLISRLESYVASLMDLLPTILHFCANDPLPEAKGATRARVPRVQASSAADYFINQVQDKFEHVDPSLARRLGEVGWERFRRLQRACMRNKEIITTEDSDSESEEVIQEEIEPSTYVPVSTFQDSGLGTSLATKSRYSASVASHKSFLSTKSSTEGALRVPKTPIQVSYGLPFPCKLCNRTVKDIDSRVKWKIHVYADLQSYICTFDDCKQSHLTFPSRKLWEEHEFTCHRYQESYRCGKCERDFDACENFKQHVQTKHHDLSEFFQQWMIQNPLVTLSERDIKQEQCPLCQRNDFKDRRDFATHVGRHLEQVALVSLPASLGSDRESDEDSGLDGDNDDHGPSILRHGVTGDRSIVPTIDGFRSRMRDWNPNSPQFLCDRLGDEHQRCYTKLMDWNSSHDRRVNDRRCPSGGLCIALGGKARLLPSREGSKQSGKPGLLPNLQAYGTTDAERIEVTAAQNLYGIPLPPVSTLPAEVECQLCYKTTRIYKPSDWIKHVYYDLQPYVCTFPQCAGPKSFKRKADWARHEMERHRQIEWWQCDMSDCNYNCYRKDNFFQHLVQEHKLPEPTNADIRASKKKYDLQAPPNTLPHGQVALKLVTCRFETSKRPSEELCRFCGNYCNSWKELMVHLANHMELSARGVLVLLPKMDTANVGYDSVPALLDHHPPVSIEKNPSAPEPADSQQNQDAARQVPRSLMSQDPRVQDSHQAGLSSSRMPADDFVEWLFNDATHFGEGDGLHLGGRQSYPFNSASSDFNTGMFSSHDLPQQEPGFEPRIESSPNTHTRRQIDSIEDTHLPASGWELGGPDAKLSKG